ncbi:hypothetical protein J6590_044211 [Homalodisca vitripennis]|nr:hypothetical protein J6590_044211 [Homalodisca vitripennis]
MFTRKIFSPLPSRFLRQYKQGGGEITGKHRRLRTTMRSSSVGVSVSLSVKISSPSRSPDDGLPQDSSRTRNNTPSGV